MAKMLAKKKWHARHASCGHYRHLRVSQGLKFTCPVSASQDFGHQLRPALPELRIHCLTLGKRHRNSSGEIDNAVLLLHSTSNDAAELLGPRFSGPLYGPSDR
jgi:hypothetical protein